MIIDPLIDLSASTYLGGSGWDGAYAIAIDSNGNVFVAGSTQAYSTRSNDFPIVNGYDDTYNGAEDVFVAKFG